MEVWNWRNLRKNNEAEAGARDAVTALEVGLFSALLVCRYANIDAVSMQLGRKCCQGGSEVR